MVLSTPGKWIRFLSYAYHGISHDLSMLRTEIPAERGHWFSSHIIHVDLAFLGLDKDYRLTELCIPTKRKRNQELTEMEKELNKKKSAKRVVVENSIGGMKRYRFLSDRLRCRDMGLYNQVAGVCAGLWIYNLSG